MEQPVLEDRVADKPKKSDCDELRTRCGENPPPRNERTSVPRCLRDLPPPQFLSREDAAWARLPDPGSPVTSKLAHAVDMPSPPATEIFVFDLAETMMVSAMNSVY